MMKSVTLNQSINRLKFCIMAVLPITVFVTELPANVWFTMVWFPSILMQWCVEVRHVMLWYWLWLGHAPHLPSMRSLHIKHANPCTVQFYGNNLWLHTVMCVEKARKASVCMCIQRLSKKSKRGWQTGEKRISERRKSPIKRLQLYCWHIFDFASSLQSGKGKMIKSRLFFSSF